MKQAARLFWKIWTLWQHKVSWRHCVQIGGRQSKIELILESSRPDGVYAIET
jgi:hypothetical protein